MSPLNKVFIKIADDIAKDNKRPTPRVKIGYHKATYKYVIQSERRGKYYNGRRIYMFHGGITKSDKRNKLTQRRRTEWTNHEHKMRGQVNINGYHC